MEPKTYTIPTFDAPDPDSLFLASRHGLRTYADLERYQNFFLQLLHDFEVDPARPIGFLIHSCDELILAIASCWKLGIPFVCFNPTATSFELKRQIQQINPGVLFVEKELSKNLPAGNQVYLKQLDVEKALSVKLEPSEQVRQYNPDTGPEQVFGYFLTSGTSGFPKMVPLKRRQMLYAAASSAQNFRPGVNHFWLLCLPLNHIGGVSIILRSLLYGSGIYRMNNFDEQMVATFLSENKLFQVASLVPTMLKRLVDIQAFQTHKNFKAILLGGGPVDPALLDRSVKKGIPLVSSYGMTETCAQISANPLLEPSGIYAPIKSVGTVFEPNEIEIRDDTGKALGANNPGSIWLKGPQMFGGYLNTDLNNEMFDKNGWFNTGDFGHLNGNGQLFIESRRSDLIITGGENVSPYEVESELEKIDPITEAAVLGIPDGEWGQQVVAVVVAKTKKKIQTEEIQNKLKERITSFKVPKQIVQIDSLPKNHSGKIIRGELLKFFEK